MSTDENAVIAAEAARYAAMIAGDVGALEALLDEDLVYSHSNGSRDSRETYLKKFTDGYFVYHRVDAPVERLLIIGDCAVLAGQMNAEVSVGDEKRSLSNGCLAVYRRANGQWKLVAYQPTPLR